MRDCSGFLQIRSHICVAVLFMQQRMHTAVLLTQQHYTYAHSITFISAATLHTPTPQRSTHMHSNSITHTTPLRSSDIHSSSTDYTHQRRSVAHVYAAVLFTQQQYT